MKLEWDIKHLPKITSNGDQGHWAKRAQARKTTYRIVASQILADQPPSPYDRAKMTLIRCSSSEPDYDNLVISFKPVIDVFVRTGFLVDDKMRNIEVKYGWEKAKIRQGGIKITFEPIEGESK